MRIICWNVNGLRANVKKGGFDWFLNESPDIFCIQETKVQSEQLEEGVRNPAGYHSYLDHSKGRKGYSGVAVYTKIKPEKVEYGLGIEKYDQEGRLLALFFKDFVLLNIYFPNGGGGPDRLKFKLEFYNEFLSYIDELRKKGHEIVFCGDVNTAHTEIDLARPKENENNTGFLPVERKWIDELMSHGYVDVFRHFYPGVKDRYTYWDMKTFARERNVGWRIDYFFISPGLLNKVDKMRILDEILGSDHCPIELDMR
ncbi:MAG: exodeoxyribonuclease III [Candidatus Taylorbacteria bacterium]|nr:exodeoxyribonuclease III [Candidatus Taylorbacteria bacterium]